MDAIDKITFKPLLKQIAFEIIYILDEQDARNKASDYYNKIAKDQADAYWNNLTKKENINYSVFLTRMDKLEARPIKFNQKDYVL